MAKKRTKKTSKKKSSTRGSSRSSTRSSTLQGYGSFESIMRRAAKAKRPTRFRYDRDGNIVGFYVPLKHQSKTEQRKATKAMVSACSAGAYRQSVSPGRTCGYRALKPGSRAGQGLAYARWGFPKGWPKARFHNPAYSVAGLTVKTFKDEEGDWGYAVYSAMGEPLAINTGEPSEKVAAREGKAEARFQAEILSVEGESMRNPKKSPNKKWIVEMTIHGSVRPVQVSAANRESAKDVAAAKHPEATRIYGAYTLSEWRKVLERARGNPKKSLYSKAEIEKARKLGEAAFKAGKTSVPSQDAALMRLFKPGPIGSSVPLLEAWANGWHTANLRAPVPNASRRGKSNPKELPANVKAILSDFTNRKATTENLSKALATVRRYVADSAPGWVAKKASYTNYSSDSGPWASVPDSADASLDVLLEGPRGEIHWISIHRPPLSSRKGQRGRPRKKNPKSTKRVSSVRSLVAKAMK